MFGFTPGVSKHCLSFSSSKPTTTSPSQRSSCNRLLFYYSALLIPVTQVEVVAEVTGMIGGKRVSEALQMNKIMKNTCTLPTTCTQLVHHLLMYTYTCMYMCM